MRIMERFNFFMHINLIIKEKLCVFVVNFYRIEYELRYEGRFFQLLHHRSKSENG